MQEPAQVAGGGIAAVAAAEQPEPAALLVLDREVVAHRGHLGSAAPPFAMDALGAVGAADAVALAAPGEGDRRLIGQQRDGFDRLRRVEQRTERGNMSGHDVAGPSPIAGTAATERPRTSLSTAAAHSAKTKAILGSPHDLCKTAR